MLKSRTEASVRTDFRAEGGYTLIELLVVMAVMAVVLVIAASALISMQNTTSRNAAMVKIEQDASTTLALLARDIRSAHSITFVSSTTNAANAVVLNENQPNGSGTSPIEWVYTPPSGSAVVGTLSRVVLASSLTPKSTEVMLTNLSNGASNPVFTYYDLHGDSMSTSGSTANQTLQNCTTGIGVNFVTSPSPVPGITTFSETDEVAITDQQQLLSAPGNGQCGI